MRRRQRDSSSSSSGVSSSVFVFSRLEAPSPSSSRANVERAHRTAGAATCASMNARRLQTLATSRASSASVPPFALVSPARNLARPRTNRKKFKPATSASASSSSAAADVASANADSRFPIAPRVASNTTSTTRRASAKGESSEDEFFSDDASARCVSRVRRERYSARIAGVVFVFASEIFAASNANLVSWSTAVSRRACASRASSRNSGLGADATRVSRDASARANVSRLPDEKDSPEKHASESRADGAPPSPHLRNATAAKCTAAALRALRTPSRECDEN